MLQTDGQNHLMVWLIFLTDILKHLTAKQNFQMDSSKCYSLSHKTLNTRENFWNFFVLRPIGCAMKPQKITA